MKAEYSLLCLGIDVGGSATKIHYGRDSFQASLDFPSLNPASGDLDRVSQLWIELLRSVTVDNDDATLSAWIGDAAVCEATIDRQTALITRAARAAAVTGRFALTNDLMLLLFGEPCNGEGVVIGVGTGSGVVGRRCDGVVAKVGGYEYVISDEGGGFDIGRLGLQAAARAFDGRGPATALLSVARELFAADIPGIGRILAESDDTKRLVASFASSVLEAWNRDDQIAETIIEHSIEEIYQGVKTVLARLGKTPALPCSIVGSIATSDRFFDSLVSHLSRDRGLGEIERIREPASVAFALANSPSSFECQDISSLPLSIFEISK